MPHCYLLIFEIEIHCGIKMLHEMRPGEMGSMIVSAPVLARYKIGDLIRTLEPPCFRCIGRDRLWTPLRYVWDAQPGQAVSKAGLFRG